MYLRMLHIVLLFVRAPFYVLLVFKSNQIFICSNERNQKIDNNSDNEQDNKAQEAPTAALVAVCSVFWLFWLSCHYLPSDWLERLL